MTTISRAVDGTSRSQFTGSVGYGFGVLEATAVPGSILVPLLTDLGMSTSAVRTMLHRMVAAGSLESERVGRVTVYRLAGLYAERFTRLREGEVALPWEGRFQLVLYDIPEVRRQHRDELREAAFKAGFAATRPGVLLGFRDAHRWCQPWLTSPDLSVELGELFCSLPTARRLAERAWGLTAIQPILTAFAAELADIDVRLANDEYGNQEAFRLQASLWERWVGIAVRLPALPAALTPAPWPVDDLAAAMDRLTRQLQPRAIAHSATVAARAERADLLVLLADRKYQAAVSS